MNVLFVCIGNACRSPMAEGLFNFESIKLGKDHKARSAGVRPYFQVINESVKVMNELGINISNHKPKHLTREMMDWADKIILLDRDITDELINLPFNKKYKIIIWDIEDPFNTSKENFRRVRNILNKEILEILSS